MADAAVATAEAIATQQRVSLHSSLWQVIVAERGTIALASVALAVRLWGIGFGLPYESHPDEPVVFSTVVFMLRNGTANPHTFIYPSGLYYTFALIGTIYQLVTGTHLDYPTDAAGMGLYPNPGAVLSMRVGTVLLGVAAVVVVYRTARAFAGTWPAAAGALLLALAPLHVDQSQVATTDGASATGFALCAACATLAARTGRREAFWFAGIAIGVATGIKYNTLAGAAMIAVAYGLVLWRDVKAGSRLTARGLLRDQRLIAFVLIPVAFLLTTPMALVSPHIFLTDVQSVYLHYGIVGHSGNAGSSLLFTLQYLFDPTEALLSVLACIGIVSIVVRRRVVLLPLLAGALTYFVVVAAPKVHFARNLTPLWPLLALLAAEGVVYLGHLLGHLLLLLGQRFGSHASTSSILASAARSSGVRTAVLSLVLVAGSIPLVGRTIELDTYRSATDVRVEASTWIEQHLPAGTSLAIEPYSVTLDSQRYQITYEFDGLYAKPLNWYAQNGVQYVVASHLFYYRFYGDNATVFTAAHSFYETILHQWTVVQQFDGPNTFFGTPHDTIVLLRVPPVTARSVAAAS